MPPTAVLNHQGEESSNTQVGLWSSVQKGEEVCSHFNAKKVLLSSIGLDSELWNVMTGWPVGREACEKEGGGGGAS